MDLFLLISVPLAFSCGHCFALLRVYFSVYCPFYQYCGSLSQGISHFNPFQTISLAEGLVCHSCDKLKNILLQVEKPAQSLGCDYWIHHLCYLGIFLKAAVWSVLEDVMIQLSQYFSKVFPSTCRSVCDFFVLFLVVGLGFWSFLLV